MQGLLLSALVLAASASPAAGPCWRGTVRVDGIAYAPLDSHPYTTTIRVHLCESARTPIAGGFRMALISKNSMYDVQNQVYDPAGKLVCSGTGAEVLTDVLIGYLETSTPGHTTYHLIIPRAWGSFGCGQNQAITGNRAAVIGQGNPGPNEIWPSETWPSAIEAADSRVRTLEQGDSVMQGEFNSTTSKEFGGGKFRWEFKVSWSIRREDPAP